MSSKILKSFCIYLLSLLLIFPVVHAQNKEFIFPKESLKSRMQQISKRTDTNIIFDGALLAKIEVPALTVSNESREELLKKSLINTGFTSKTMSDGSVVIKKEEILQKEKNVGSGRLSGHVTDERNEPVIGASVFVPSTAQGTITDIDGKYNLQVPAGGITIEVSFLSYEKKIIKNINIHTGKTVTLDVMLKESAQQLGEITVSGKIKQSSTSGMHLLQKQSVSMIDALSAEQLSKAPDSDMGAALKRIAGVSTVDDKHVVVRSLGERWNQAMMDGINLPSTDAHQQNFSFDIIPTSMVEGIIVTKTAAPDMNANFAGAAVEVRTKDIPQEDFVQFSVGEAYNSRSTFKEQLTKKQGKYDFWGFDDGSRDYPSQLEEINIPKSEAEAGPFIAQSKRFTNDNFSVYKTSTPLSPSLQFAIGKSYDLNETSTWGFVASATHKNSQTQHVIEHTERGKYMENTFFYPANSSQNREYSTMEQYGFRNSGASYNYHSALALMLNSGLQLRNHRISFRNSYIHTYDNKFTRITGWNHYEDNISSIMNGNTLPRIEEVSVPDYISFNQHKLEGEHHLGRWKLNWFGSFASVHKETKDETALDFFRKRVGDDILTYYYIYNSATNMQRQYRTNSEIIYNWGITLERNLDLGLLKNKLKTGYYGTWRYATNRHEKASMAVIAGSNTGAYNTLYYSIPTSDLLDGSHYRWGEVGWLKYNYYGGQYQGEVNVHAPFLMFDQQLGSHFRLVWGARAESYVYQEISSQKDDAYDWNNEQLDDKQWQFLPSAAFTYTPVEPVNIRLSYSKSVIRPQFSERLTIPYYDAERSALVLNYTNGIASTAADNYDFKVEYFPTMRELISVSYYRKNIDKPIEAVARIGGDGGSRFIYNMNSHSARLWGVELEMHKNLGFLGEGKALENLFVTVNASYNQTKVTSYVNLDGTGGLYTADRPLFGQSPYMYNLGIDYTGDRFALNIRYNGSGDQYLMVGYDYNAEEIRKPYATTDAQVSWRFLPEHNLELKTSVQNLFDTAYETYNNYNTYQGEASDDFEVGSSSPRERNLMVKGATKHYDKGIDRVLFRSFNGRTIKLTITYNF